MMGRLLMFWRTEFQIASGAGWSGDAIEVRALLGLGLAEGTAQRGADVLLLVAGMQIDTGASPRQLVLLLGVVIVFLKHLAGRWTTTKPAPSIFIALEIGEVGQQLPGGGQPNRHCGTSFQR